MFLILPSPDAPQHADPPLDDVGLLKGISLNYFSGEPVSRAEAGKWARPGPVAVCARSGGF